MAKDQSPGGARTWSRDEARRILKDGAALLSTLQTVAGNGKVIVDAVDAAVGSAAVRLPTNLSPHAASPLGGMIAVTLASGQAPGHVAGHAQASRQLEERFAALSPTVDKLRPQLGALLTQSSRAGSRLRFAFSGRDRKDAAVAALGRAEELIAQTDASGLRQALEDFASGSRDLPPFVPLAANAYVIHRIGRALGLQPPADVPWCVTGEDLVTARALAREGRVALKQRPALVEAVRTRFVAVQDRMVERQLREIPVASLKEATAGRIRFKTLGDAKVHTVYDALHPRFPLAGIHGISDTMAQQVRAAALQVAQAVRDDLRFRIDLDKADFLVTDLLTTLHTLLGFDAFFDGQADDLQAATDFLTPLLSLPGASTEITLLEQRGDSGVHIKEILRWAHWARQGDVLSALARASQPKASAAAPAEVWSDFERRSPAYYAVLGQIVDLRLDIEASEGFLPQEIVDRVHQQVLDETFLRVSLRGYQSFGARYALVQRKVILGDEMGLGKTVQAIAVMAHLEASGNSHYLVVCPASVLINWTREVRLHCTLRAHQVHGSDRDRTWKTWQKYGGVAITTFDTLRTLEAPEVAIALLTIDEAHYVKNPATVRAKYVIEYVDAAERTLFMTGTPMENRVEEFRQLIQYLQPEVSRRVSATDGIAGARRFRETVAPVYLRRNSEDVLQELPPMVQVDEWEEFDRAEWLAYRNAVAAGNFMLMRRVAFLANSAGSTKLLRLIELADEAGANGHKVIVFSYFREVLEIVAAALGGRAVGPLTGSIPAARRQQFVDEFTTGPSTAVMVSQIQAGGVGLNMQAGSVVILCEPQVKPSLEAQAIARAHRMGQVRTVQVHRLLIADSVDQRMIEILDSKQQLFDEYARGSDIADASPEAIDVSEKALARQVVELEQERLALRLANDLGVQEGGQD